MTNVEKLAKDMEWIIDSILRECNIHYGCHSCKFYKSGENENDDCKIGLYSAVNHKENREKIKKWLESEVKEDAKVH